MIQRQESKKESYWCMKKGDIIEGTIERLRFPNKGTFRKEEYEVTVKNTVPGQRVRVRISKRRDRRAEGCLLEVLEPGADEITPPCPQFGSCGGCLYLNLPAEKELLLKEQQLRDLFRGADPESESWYEGILESPVTAEYRNKMELTFGDERKDGPLTLGMHRRGSFYDVTNAEECRIIDRDFRTLIGATREYWAGCGAPFYHRLRQQGYLRHLLIRKGMKTGEILADLVTTTQTAGLLRAQEESGEAEAEACLEREKELLRGWKEHILSLDYEGHITGILHTKNDSAADVVADQGTEILFGKGEFEEELLGLRFTVTPFSFFQTNSSGAELLYETARKMISEAVGEQKAEEGSGADRRKPVIYDLYCGTGTISELVAPVAEKVIGVEIVEEAVHAARENAVRNRISNCEFIAGDVLKVIDGIEEKPDFIILDPPRDGVHPKALPKILRYGVPCILYISCKPTSLARDLPIMRELGYVPVRGISVNQFPKTANVETIVLLSNRGQDAFSFAEGRV